MSLIRSEHINDQAIRVAKESVISAEAALEESRTQLEKRERAQYHEEQIWSDTIRRNSTWVTFVLMGVNIFLLLLSLAILEPWRRRRMVREIKDVLETQRPALSAAPISVAPAVAPSQDVRDTTAIEEEIDRVIEADDVEAELTTPTPSTLPEEIPTSKPEESQPTPPTPAPETPEPAESVIDPHFGVATPGPVPLAPEPLPQHPTETTEPTPLDTRHMARQSHRDSRRHCQPSRHLDAENRLHDGDSAGRCGGCGHHGRYHGHVWPELDVGDV
jgi:sensitive to high expression protein 9